MGYVCWLAAALAAGLWPEAIYPSPDPLRSAPLPVLGTLAIGQGSYFLLVWPLILCRRRLREPATTRRGLPVAEWVGLLVAAAPFYLAAACLADATLADVLRLVIYLVGMVLLGWSAGAWLAQPRARSVTLLAVLVILLGLPGGYYVAREFFAVQPGHWLWHLAPATSAWTMAASRGDSWAPAPAWAAIVWPAVAGAAGLALVLASRRGPRPV